jgi:putative DNA primase/helicase
MTTLQEHMLETIGQAIANPSIDGRWHSGKPAQDGKSADKISYVGHYLPKGLLVRYRDQRTPDVFHVWKEWDGEQIHFDAAEYQQRKAQAEARARQAEAIAAAEKARVLGILKAIISESVPASHDLKYPLGKRILALAARQATKRYELVPATTDTKAQYITPNDLLIPVYDHTGGLQGIQTIAPDGAKLLRGSLKHGLLWIGGGLNTGETTNRLYIAEGWATAVSIHMRTRNPVIVAFSTSNLLAAGHWVRGRYPSAELVYAVDNDIGSFITVAGERVENPGRHYATQAALAVNAAVITPPTDGRGDWNDWHISQITGEKKPD